MHLRIARHTSDLNKIVKFYQEIIQLEILGHFENHDGYDGVFIGKSNQDWHVEFTTSAHTPIHVLDEDDAIVFYPETQKEYDQIITNIKKHKIPQHSSPNPYWNKNAILVKDFDGHCVIISPQKINNGHS